MSTETVGKRTRSQRPSCDACRLRKIRCNNRDKVDARAKELGTTSDQLSPLDQASLSCSWCISRGLTCTFHHYSKSRQRNGRRIIEIQRNQLQQQGQSAASSSSTGNVNDQHSTALTLTVGVSTANEGFSLGLLGVEGMTRSLLECCFKMFFRFIAPIRPILHAERFREAYVNYHLPPIERTGLPPDDLLMLAVACLGASLLEPPIAEKGSTAKFMLRDRCAARYNQIIQSRNWAVWHTLPSASDIVEAVYLMSDGSFDPIAQIQMDDKSSNEVTAGKGADLFLKDAFSHDFLIELVFKLCINEAPKLRIGIDSGDTRCFVDGNGIFITADETFRRKRIFWVIFGHDTLQSFGKREMLRIGDDDYDQDLPSLFFTPEASEKRIQLKSTSGPLGSYSIYQSIKSRLNNNTFPNPSPANIVTQAAKYALFDGIFLELSLRLVFLVRSVAIHFVSTRSRGKGILLQDVCLGVGELQKWSEQIPIECQWETHFQHLSERESTVSSNVVKLETTRSNAMKALLLEYFHHGVIMCMWSSVKDFGIRSNQTNDTQTNNNNNLTESSSLSKFRIGLEDSQPRFSASSQGPEDIIKKMNELVLSSFYQIAKVAGEAQSLGLIRSSHSSFLGTTVAYTYWGIEMAKAKKFNDAADFVTIFKSCEDLVDAISTIDSYQHVQKLCKHLRASLQQTTSPPQDDHSSMNGGTNSDHATEDNINVLSINAQSDVAQLPNSWLSEWLAQEILDPLPEAGYLDFQAHEQQGPSSTETIDSWLLGNV